MRHVKLLCLLCVTSYTLTSSGMAQNAAYPIPQLPYNNSAAPAPANYQPLPTALPFAGPQPQVDRGRPVNPWSTAPSKVYVSPFQNSQPVGVHPGFQYQPQQTAVPQRFVSGPPGMPAYANGQPNAQFVSHSSMHPGAHPQPLPHVNSGDLQQPPMPFPPMQQPMQYGAAQNTPAYYSSNQTAPNHDGRLLVPQPNLQLMQNGAFTNTVSEHHGQPPSAGHSFPDSSAAEQNPAPKQSPAPLPIHVYPPNIRLKN